MIQSNTLSQPRPLSIKGTFIAALWIALIIPVAAFGVAREQSSPPLSPVPEAGFARPLTNERISMPSDAANNPGVRDLNTLMQISMLDADRAKRVHAGAQMNALRRQWSNAMGVPMSDWNVSATAPQNTQKVVVAVRRDLFLSNDGGQTFERLMNVLPSILDTLAISPADDSMFYAGVDGLGFYASHDNGQTWQPSNMGIQVMPGARLGITAITIHPTNAETMYIAAGLWLGTGGVTYYPLGILKTTDGGKTWTPVETGSVQEVQYLFLDANTLHIWSQGQHTAYRVN